MSVWSGTVPQGRAWRVPRWLRLVLAIIAALVEPEDVDEAPDEPGTNFGGW